MVSFLKLFNRYKAVEEVAFNFRNKNREMATRVWVSDDFELRVRKKGDTTPWAVIKPEILENLPDQDPKVTKHDSDKMDRRRPKTPRETNNPEVTLTRFNSSNIYNLLGEVEAN